MPFELGYYVTNDVPSLRFLVNSDSFALLEYILFVNGGRQLSLVFNVAVILFE